MTTSTFDAFLSYNAKHDEDEAVALHQELVQRGLTIWFDKTEVGGGSDVQDELAKGIENAKAFLFLFGPSGMGPWQNQEQKVAFMRKVDGGMKIIPILLPGGTKPTDLPTLLRTSEYMRFGESVHEEVVLDNIVFAVTGRRPKSAPPPVPPPPVPDDTPEELKPVRQAIKNLAGSLRSGPVTFFLGPNLVPEQDASYPPRVSDIVGHLMKESNLIRDCPRNPPCFPWDVACDYSSVEESEQLIEDKVTEVIKRRSGQIPHVHERLAHLLGKTLQTRGTPRGQTTYLQLVVTTNLDVLTERALLRHGVPFTRVVADLAKPAMEVNQYWEERQNGSEKGKIVLANDFPQDPDDTTLDDFIRDHGRATFLPGPKGDYRGGGKAIRKPKGQRTTPDLSKLDRAPVLMKYCGSVDLRGTCILSSEQAMKIVASRVNVPGDILMALNNTPWLFLGYGLLNPELRFLYHTVLRESRDRPGKEHDARYAVLPRPNKERSDAPPQMESPIWEEIKAHWPDWRGVTHFVESSVDTFLDELMTELSKVPGP